MIELKGVSKRFGDIQAVRNVSLSIKEGEIFGLLGTNGSGKSTILRMLSGVYRPDAGEILVDGSPVYENPAVKEQICFLSDNSYFFQNATPLAMAQAYEVIYPKFSRKRYLTLLEKAGLDKNRKISTFSKGMQKQVAVLLGISAGTQYLLCDETFDGLDPVMRQAVKSIFATELLDRSFTPVIASHNLRELEDLCDHIGLLHQGGILLTESLEELKFHAQKVQCVIRDEHREAQLLKELQVMHCDRRGSMITIIARGTRTEVLERVAAADPLFMEALPLTLEELFIFETEVAGYDLKALIS
ncbi:MAG: ABC transporter ATP-binding protein [Eubacterium sp.]|nr:ABC transporter ATP-binding protein [Eubacterium sp.]